jgi:hypothetical protein
MTKRTLIDGMAKRTLMDRINRINNGYRAARWGCVHVWVNDQTNIDGQDKQDK